MASFNYIQSFIIKNDKLNSPYAFITAVNLYFSNRPPATENKSGIVRPGATVYICPFVNGEPNPDLVVSNQYSSVDWGSIAPAGDASMATRFTFNTPITIESDRYYGIVVKFEDPDFELWKATQNEAILNTTTIYSGAAGEGDGKLYAASNDDALQALSDKDIKFDVFIAQFAANSAVVELVNKDYEFFTCSNMSTAKKFKGGEIVFQNFGKVANSTVNTFYSKVGTVSITKGNTSIDGVNTTFLTDYPPARRILLTNQANVEQQFVSRVDLTLNDTSIILADAPSFTGNCWHMPIVTGTVSDRDYLNRTLYLTDSIASNSTVRFFENAVQYFTISSPGSGYTNGDVVTVSNGSIDAEAAIVTDASGNVVSLRLYTPGADFPNASHSVLTITTSTGAGASLAPVIGAPLKGLVSGATADLVSIDNAPADIIDPDINIVTTSTTYANAEFTISNTSYGVEAFRPIDLLNAEDVPYDGFVASRSNEVRNTTNLYRNDKSSVIRVTLGIETPNSFNESLFFAPYLYEDDIDVFTFENYIDPTSFNADSEIGRGTAQSKHITKKINFANNQFAEDIRVYINAYKPAETNILVYAKIHNSTDSEAYDDKSWSPLELKEGINKISARENKDDIKEYTYGFPQTPQVDQVCPGTAKTTLSSAAVTTTSDLTSILSTNDLVRVYNPLFSTTNYIISPVASVTSTTVTLKDVIPSNDLVGTGMKIDKLKFKNVAFNNILNDNVARYYNSSMVAFDTYDSMSIKVVFLSDNRYISPEIDDIRVIAVSA